MCVCRICDESFLDSDPVTVLACKHIFHLVCVSRLWMMCPVCAVVDPSLAAIESAVCRIRRSSRSRDVAPKLTEVLALMNMIDDEPISTTASRLECVADALDSDVFVRNAKRVGPHKWERLCEGRMQHAAMHHVMRWMSTDEASLLSTNELVASLEESYS